MTEEDRRITRKEALAKQLEEQITELRRVQTGLTEVLAELREADKDDER